jgi:hypothetical protein
MGPISRAAEAFYNFITRFATFYRALRNFTPCFRSLGTMGSGMKPLPRLQEVPL